MAVPDNGLNVSPHCQEQFTYPCGCSMSTTVL